MAVDYQGDVISATDPTGGSNAWKSVTITSPYPYNMALQDISCPTSTLCVAVGANANGVFVSTNPTGGPNDGSVHNPTSADLPFYRPETISCPSTALCVTSDGFDVTGTLTDPAGAATWNVQRVSAEL